VEARLVAAIRGGTVRADLVDERDAMCLSPGGQAKIVVLVGQPAMIIEHLAVPLEQSQALVEPSLALGFSDAIHLK
jgi:hypothetical protein